MLRMQSEAKRFLAALEKRCQLAGSSEVSVAQMHVLGTKINLSVPDMDAFIEQLNDAGTRVLFTPCRGVDPPVSKSSEFLHQLARACREGRSQRHINFFQHWLGIPYKGAMPSIHTETESGTAGVILKKGRSMYEVPSAKSNLVPLAGVQQSQSRSGCSAQPADNSQFYTRSVAKPMTPSYAEAH